jgi:hypothetical protein
VKAAEAFCSGFEPRPDVDYTWAAEFAEKRYAEADRDFEYADSKAASLVVHLGSGAGLLGVVGLAGLATGRAGAAIVLAGFPSFSLAVAALWFALRARQPATGAAPPTVASAVGYAEYFTKPKVGCGGLLGQWHMATEVMRAATTSKARLIRRATLLTFAAVAALTLPLIAGIWVRLAVSDPVPAVPQVVVNNQLPTGQPPTVIVNVPKDAGKVSDTR